MPLKRIIDACGACFERPDVFPAEALAAALQKMVEFTPLPLLFMRTVIQAETAAPTLREFTLGLLRTLARRQVWRMDPKIWEGFARCAKRSAPRSFPLLCELPPSALGEMLGKFPAMRQPLLAYASARRCSRGYRGRSWRFCRRISSSRGESGSRRRRNNSHMVLKCYSKLALLTSTPARRLDAQMGPSCPGQ